MKPHIAYVDDDKKNLDYYQKVLSDKFKVTVFQSSHEFLSSLKDSSYESYILDVYMPVMDGFQLFDELLKHPHYKKAPIFYVTANPQDEHRVSSYKQGVVDYFDRMVSDEELIARLESRLTLFKNNKSFLSLGNLTADHMAIECRIDKELVPLTLIEFKLLSTLLRGAPAILPKDTLLKEVWGESILHQNNLNTHLYNLRQKTTAWNYEINSHKTKGIWISSKGQAALP